MCGRGACAQIQGFGSENLLTAAEERMLSRRVQTLIAAGEAQETAVQRLGRPISEAEWAAECGLEGVRELRKLLKVHARARGLPLLPPPLHQEQLLSSSLVGEYTCVRPPVVMQQGCACWALAVSGGRNCQMHGPC